MSSPERYQHLGLEDASWNMSQRELGTIPVEWCSWSP